jgi:hypothetical protein
VRAAQKVITTQVSEWLKRFLIDNDNLFVHESLEAIDETDKLHVTPQFLEP